MNKKKSLKNSKMKQFFNYYLIDLTILYYYYYYFILFYSILFSSIHSYFILIFYVHCYDTISLLITIN